MTRSSYVRQFIKTAFARAPGILIVAVLSVVLYLNVAGFPEWAASRIAAKINNSGKMVLNFGLLRLSPLHMELVFEDVKLFRKGVLGPAAVEVRELVLSIDPVALAREKDFVKRIRLAEGVVRPKMFSGSQVLSEPPDDNRANLAMVVEVENCTVQGVNVVMLSTDLNIEGAMVRLNNIGGTLGRGGMHGDVSGQLVYDNRTHMLDGRLLTQLDPRILTPLINEWDMPKVADLVSRFDFFSKPPKCEVTFKKRNNGDCDFVLEGKYSMQDCSYHGVDMLRASGRVHVDLVGSNSAVRVEIAELLRKEGVARTTFTIDLAAQTVRFDGMTGIHVPSFFQMVGVFTNECRNYFNFDGPVKIAASGIVDYGGMTNTNFRGIVEAKRLAVGPVMTDQCSFSLAMVGFTTTVTGVIGKVYDGDMTGSAAFVLPPDFGSNLTYSVDAKIENADFNKLVTSLMSGSQKTSYSGKLEGRLKISGILGEGTSKTAVGSGSVSVRKGHVFTLPVFGGLTDFITKHVPVMDFVLAQTDARADFSILNGKASTKEILVEGGIISLSGDGSYCFDGKLDFHVKVNLLKKKTLIGKVVQFITDPISELFEFKLSGTLTQPEWSVLHL